MVGASVKEINYLSQNREKDVLAAFSFQFSLPSENVDCFLSI